MNLLALIATLLVSPLQAMAVKPVPVPASPDSQPQMLLKLQQQPVAMAHDCCEQCDQNCCMDDLACANGHCSSAHAGLLSIYTYSHDALVQMSSVDYIDRLSPSYPTNLFRPPRA